MIFVTGFLIATFVLTSGDDTPAQSSEDIPGSWRLLSSGTAAILSDVDFVDPQNGWTVGEFGTILRTRDGGETWKILDGGFEVSLAAVDFVTPDEGWTVGKVGVILHTSDGGDTWELQGRDVTLGLNLIGLYFADDQNGRVITERGSAIFKTNNGGETWVREFFNNTALRSSVAFSGPDHGWIALSQGSVMVTSDAGSNWEFMSGVVSDVSIRTTGVFFLDENHGWISGSRGRSGDFQFTLFLTDGMIARTTDGGETWIRRDTSTGRFVWDVAFVDVNEGWAVGSGGIILYSDDGGANWTPQFSGTQESLRRVVFLDRNTGWAVGENGVIVNFTR